MVAEEEGSGGGMDWEFRVSRCKLLYTGWINNKVLLYSTGNYIQYPVINHHGREYDLNSVQYDHEKCLIIVALCTYWIFTGDGDLSVGLLCISVSCMLHMRISCSNTLPIFLLGFVLVLADLKRQ